MAPQCRQGSRLLGSAYGVEAFTMIYDDNHDPEPSGPKEIFGTWIFTIGMIGLVMLVLAVFN